MKRGERMSISDNLKRLRQERNLTQEQVAERLGVTRQAVSGYESGRTRPDVDTLMRLAEIYGTDLNRLLYGPEGEQKKLRCFRIAAWVILGVSVFLALASAVVYWSGHMFLSPLQDGIVTAEMKAIMERRMLLDDIWCAIDGINLTVTGLGALALLVLLLSLRCNVLWKEKLIFAGIWAGGILVVTLPFALTDPVFSPVNYLFTPWLLITRIVFFLLIALAIDFFRTRRRKAKTE